MAGEAIDLAGITQILSGLSGAITPPVLVFMIVKRIFVTGTEVTRLEGQLAAKDAALERKDEQIAALQSGLIDKAIPALTRSTLVLEQIDSRARDEAFRPSGPR